jgi:isopenicillin N synthase-like dioxygenase
VAAGAFIPIVDMGPVRAGDTVEAGRALREAFLGSGFCYVTNHGVPEAVIAQAAEQALSFFRLPLDEKLKSKPRESVRGFNAIGSIKVRGAAAPDYKELFQMGLELPADDLSVLAGQPRGPIPWPEAAPGFQPAMKAYFDAIGRSGQHLLRAVCASLDIAEDFFAGKYAKSMQRTQALYYPPHPPGDDPQLFGGASHTDYGCITLLWQDDSGGLEVQDRAGDWVRAPPIPGTLVVNIGDLLQRWSNDRYVSNHHRVTNRSGRERVSIATFYDPDYDTVVDPRDLGLPFGEASRHPPVTAGDYILGRISASQKHAAA